jgi:acetyltransferase EpsM
VKRKLIIWGASGHALVVADVIRLMGNYEIVGFLDDMNLERHNTEFCGARIIGGKEQLDILREKGIKYLMFGFGDCAARLNLSSYVRAKGFCLATAIHPKSIVANDVQIGSGTLVAGGAVINPGSTIGENVIINTCSSVDHECVIEDGCHIGPGVHLGGKVTVGQGAWLGIGATVKDRVRIGAGSIIGIGSVVLEDIPDGVVAHGIPAKVTRRVK